MHSMTPFCLECMDVAQTAVSSRLELARSSWAEARSIPPLRRRSSWDRDRWKLGHPTPPPHRGPARSGDPCDDPRLRRGSNDATSVGIRHWLIALAESAGGSSRRCYVSTSRASVVLMTIGFCPECFHEVDDLERICPRWGAISEELRYEQRLVKALEHRPSGSPTSCHAMELASTIVALEGLRRKQSFGASPEAGSLARRSRAVLRSRTVRPAPRRPAVHRVLVDPAVRRARQSV